MRRFERRTNRNAFSRFRPIRALAAWRRRKVPLPTGRQWGIDYWTKRTAQLGAGSVVDTRQAKDLDAVTARQRERLFPELERLLVGGERLVLDFGCGAGRFTSDLAALVRAPALGVDPTAGLLELAPAGPGVSYKVMVPGAVPLEDASADVVWICLVLGGIPEPTELARTVDEIDRVLAPGGLLFAVENTSGRPPSPTWTYRSVADYQRLLAFAQVGHLGGYRDLGEQFSILAGRKPGLNSWAQAKGTVESSRDPGALPKSDSD